MSDARAGVVIVHYGQSEPTLRCVASVVEDPSEIPRSIVVVDNLGNFEHEAVDGDIQVLKRSDNPGFGAAVNAGVKLLSVSQSFTLYVVLNNDSELRPGFLDAAAHAIEVGVAAAGGPVHDGSERNALWYAGGRIDFATGTVRQSHFPAAALRRRDVGYIPAAALAISPTAWREVGGFDERFFLYNEDVDLSLRFRREGWRLLFEPGMVCDHSLGGSTGSGDRSPLYLENLTRTRLMPFRPWPYRLYLGALHTMYNTLRCVGLLVRHTTGSGPYLKAVFRGQVAALSTIFGSGSLPRG